jgi:hypothetical protein
MAMNDRFAKWERLRAKGKWDFIVKYGVLGWGVTTGVLFSIIFPWMLPFPNKPSFWLMLPLSLVLFPLGGVAWGYFMWIFSEKAYRKAKDEDAHS